MHISHNRAFVWWLSLAQLISWGSGFYGFALFMGPMEAALGVTRAESSLAFSLALLCEGLLAFAVGRWIDQGHAQRVMTAGSLLVAAALVAHRWVDSLYSFYAVWMLIGAGWAATLYNPAFAVLTREFPHDYRRAIITMTFLGGLASTVFIPLVAALVQGLGWRDALWVLAALHMLVCAPLHAWVLRHVARTPPPHTDALHAAPTSLRSHVRSAPFWLLGTFIVLLMAVTTALPPHMVSLLREAGMNEAWAIAVPASVGVLQVVGRVLLFVLEHRLNVHVANRWIPTLVPLGVALLLWGYGEPAWALGFVLFYGVGNGMLTIVKGTAMAEYVSRAHTGALNGLLGVPLAVSRAAAPWALGLLWSAQAGYRWGLWLMLGVSLVGLAALWQAQRLALEKRRRP